MHKIINITCIYTYCYFIAMYQTCIIQLHYFKIIILFIFSVNMAERSASAICEYFTMFQDRLEIAKCNICNQKIRRGPPGAPSKKFLTKFLWRHLKSKHKDEHSQAEEERSKETEKKKKILKKQEKILIFLIFFQKLS